MVVQVKKGAFSPGTRGSQLSENEADYLAVDKADNKADHWADSEAFVGPPTQNLCAISSYTN